MPVDFSHLANLNAIAYQCVLHRDERPTDEMLADGIAALSSPPLDSFFQRCLLRELDPTAPSMRGRPTPGAMTRKKLAAMIDALPDDAIPALLRAALLKRLNSGQIFTEQQRQAQADRLHSKRQRDMFIRGLYRDFSSHKDGLLVHKILGPIDTSCAVETDPHHLQTVAIVAKFVRDQLGFTPPSPRRILNIIARKKISKNVSASKPSTL